MPDGYVLTCYHVIFGLKRLRLKLLGEQESRDAEFVKEYSDPTMDIAILKIQDMTTPSNAIQLARIKPRREAYGYAFRPSTLDSEPYGHFFSGKIEPGQTLQLSSTSKLKAQLDLLPKEQQEQPWNILPQESRIGTVYNFQGASGLEQGISGGPVYDYESRKVVGLYRAVEKGGLVSYAIPMDEVFKLWPELEFRNREQVADKPLDNLAEKFGIRLLSEGGITIRQPLGLSYFQQIFDTNKVFGGRQKELDTLDKSIEERKNGYFFVSGSAGFGKTTLLANWIQRLSKKQEAKLVVHFINRRLGTDEEKFCLQNLCQQLMTLHHLGGDLSLNEKDLEHLYAELLRLEPPPGKRIIVILDGLDEARGWRFNSTIFPQSLTEDLYIVFSARIIAEKNWLTELGLSLPEDCILNLGKLSSEGVRECLEASGLIPKESELFNELSGQLFKLSEGDPFYLQDMILDLRKNGIELEKLKQNPIGHYNYLREWWKDALKEGGTIGFMDLMGILAVAQAPLTREELISINSDDELNGVNFDLLIEKSARYVIGDEVEGYQLPHNRIREFLVNDRLKDDITKYKLRMAKYCMQWAERKLSSRALDYVLVHAVHHLSEAEDLKSLISLLSAQWIHKKFERFGSFSALISDLDIGIKLSLRADPPNFVDVAAAFLVARQTAAELMQSYPASVLATLVKMNEVKRVLTILDSLGNYRGYASESLIAVASQLWAMKGKEQQYMQEDRHGQSNYEEIATDLLGRAIGMLPLLRRREDKLESLEKIIALLANNGNGGTTCMRMQLLEQALNFAKSVNEWSFQCASLGMVLEAVISSKPMDEVKSILEQSKHALSMVTFSLDRLICLPYLLPALFKLEPQVASEIVNTVVLKDITELFRSSSSPDSAILKRMLRRMAEWKYLDKSIPLAVVKQIARESINRKWGYMLGKAADSLCKLGESKIAFDLLRELKSLEAVMVATESLYSIDPETTLRWLQRAHDSSISSMHAMSMAFIGRWDRVVQLLREVEFDRSSDISEILPLLKEVLHLDHSKGYALLNQLMELGEKDENSLEKADMNAIAAQLLIGYDPSAAKEYNDRAISLCLSDFPEGDTDNWRTFLAVALHEEGKNNDIPKIVSAMKWESQKVSTFANLITITSNPNILSDYADMLVESLKNAAGKSLFDEVIDSAIVAVGHLSEKLPAIVPPLCDYIYKTIKQEYQENPALPYLAAEAKARTRFDKESGLIHFDHIIHLIENLNHDKSMIASNSVISIYSNLGAILPVVKDEGLSRLEQLRSLVDGLFTDAETKARVECAYAAAIAPVNVSKAIRIFEETIQLLIDLGKVQPSSNSIYTFTQMLDDFTSTKTGQRFLQNRIASSTMRYIVSIAPQCPMEAKMLMHKLLEAIYTIDDSRDLAQSLVNFATISVDCPANLHSNLLDECLRIFEKAKSLNEHNLSIYIIEHLAGLFLQIGNTEMIMKFERVLREYHLENIADDFTSSYECSRNLMEPSPLERYFINSNHQGIGDWRRKAFLQEIVQLARSKEQTPQVIMDLIDAIYKQRDSFSRRTIINNALGLIMIPAWRVGGTMLVASIVEQIEDFDVRFLEAVQLISKREKKIV